MANKASNFLKKLNPYNIQKGLRYLKHFGVKEFFVRLSDRLEPGGGAVWPVVCRTSGDRRGAKRTADA